MKRLRLPLTVLGGLLVLVWIADLLGQILAAPIFWMDDARSYAAGGHHLLAGQPVYAAFQLAGPYPLGDASWGHGFVYPPTAALFFAPLAGLDVAGLAIFFTAALVALGVFAYRVAIRSGLEPRRAALVALVVTVSGPAINAWSSGNVNLLVADALLASWLWPRSSGYLAVIGGLIKFFPAAGLVWTVRQRGPLWRPIAFGLGALAVATLAVGTAGWSDFLTAYGHGHSMSFYYVTSPVQALGPGLGTLVGYGLAALALFGAWHVRDERVAFALLGWAMILPAPDWWSHYFVVPLAAGLPWLCAVLYPMVARGMSQRRMSIAVPSHEEDLATSAK